MESRPHWQLAHDCSPGRSSRDASARRPMTRQTRCTPMPATTSAYRPPSCPPCDQQLDAQSPAQTFLVHACSVLEYRVSMKLKMMQTLHSQAPACSALEQSLSGLACSICHDRNYAEHGLFISRPTMCSKKHLHLSLLEQDYQKGKASSMQHASKFDWGLCVHAVLCACLHASGCHGRHGEGAIFAFI